MQRVGGVCDLMSDRSDEHEDKILHRRTMKSGKICVSVENRKHRSSRVGERDLDEIRSSLLIPTTVHETQISLVQQILTVVRGDPV